MTDTEMIHELFGSDMILISETVLADCDLPLATKDWLATMGVPRSVELPFGLVLDGLDDLKPITNKFQSGLRIGVTDGPTYMVIIKDGAVVMLDKTDEPERFVNSSVSQFILSLCAFRELTQSKIKVEEFQSRLSEIDSGGTSNGDTFWSIALEEIINFELYQL